MKNYTFKARLMIRARSEDEARKKINGICRREYCTSSQLVCKSIGELIKEEYREEKRND